MKISKYIYILFLAFSMSACSSSDDSDSPVYVPGAPSFDDSAAGARMKAFYDKYGVYCQTDVPSKDLYYAWTTSDNWSTSSMDYEYEDVKDRNYVVKAIDFLENEVMSNFPKDIFNTYVGLNIALEGRMFNTVELEDYLNYSKLSDYPNLTTSFQEPIYGWNGTRYLLLSPVGPEFDSTDKNTLKRKWTALIFTEALKNLPNPDEFDQANEDAWKSLWYIYDDIIQGDKPSGWYYNSYLGGYQSPYVDGLLEPGSIMSALVFDEYEDEDAMTGYSVGIEKYYNATTCLPAFASYVAYIMYASAAEKAEVRAGNEQVIKNEQLVKDYCKQYLNWDIPELGE